MSEDIREIRLQKLARMRELGHDPFSVEEFKRTASANELLDRFEELAGSESAEAQTITFAGRVVSYRDMGKAGFAHLSDGDGKIQIYCRKDELGEVGWELYRLIDIGDHVGVEGFVFLTKTGEKSIHVKRLVPLSKSLQVLPIGKEKDGQQWYGLEDVEQRYRHRHLDLITNPEARKALLDRAKIVSAVRRYFDGAGYLEVETPLLQVVAGGAAARPFTTHYNAYDMDVKLRISLELYLKRLICGDIPAVYEIGRVFRNEGISNRHNPEFTLLEFYEAYTNLEGMMRRVEEMFAFVAQQVYDTKLFVYWNGGFRPAWRQPDGSMSWSTGLVPGDPQPRWPGAEVSFAGPFLVEMRQTSAPTDPAMEPVGKGPLEIEGYEISLQEDGTFRAHGGRGYQAFGCVLDQVFNVSGHVIEVPGNSQVRFTLISEIDRERELKNIRNYFEVDFAKPWRRVDLLGEICAQSGLDRDDLGDLARAKEAIKAKGIVDKAHQLGGHIDLNKEDNLGGLIEKLLEVFVEPTLQEPTFVVGYPIETSPLAKKDPSNPRMTRRFEGYILGREICNAFSEINDPLDQKERFEQQAAEIAKGDDEAHPYDEEFLYALEGGMPPTGGCGIGMERLAMVLTGSDHIREIMFFPMMKPRE